MFNESNPKFTPDELESFFGKQPERVSDSEILERAVAVLGHLNLGTVRVWDPGADRVNVWCKIAILEFFRLSGSSRIASGCFEYFDKLPLKTLESLKGVRTAPGAIVRFGSFVEAGAILMPCFVNVGAYVGSGTMVDTWATVGSCAQIGRNVHLSGGVGIGGVLEPPQAKPVVVEDGAFIGSRAIVVEGVRIGTEAVVGAGVVLTASTKIIDVRGGAPQISNGAIPPRAVVIPGTVPKQFSAGTFQVPCALIIGTRTQSTNLKTSLNEVLREHSVSV